MGNIHNNKEYIIVECKNCGKSNRIKIDSINKRVICGDCWAVLDIDKEYLYSINIDKKISEKQDSYNFATIDKIVIAIFIFIFIFSLMASMSENKKNTQIALNNIKSDSLNFREKQNQNKDIVSSQSINQTEVLNYLENKCNNYDIESCFTLAQKLYESKKYHQASVLYEKACNNGHYIACSKLGDIYENGLGVKSNYTKAYEYHQIACKGKVIYSCERIKFLTKYSKNINSEKSKQYRYVEERGSINYKNDNLTSKHNIKAEEMKSIDKKSLAEKYYYGDGVERDLLKAFKLYEEGCINKDSFSCFKLAMMYLLGEGVNTNLEMAKKFFNESCKLGYEKGCRWYSRIK